MAIIKINGYATALQKATFCAEQQRILAERVLPVFLSVAQKMDGKYYNVRFVRAVNEALTTEGDRLYTTDSFHIKGQSYYKEFNFDARKTNELWDDRGLVTSYNECNLNYNALLIDERLICRNGRIDANETMKVVAFRLGEIKRKERELKSMTDAQLIDIMDKIKESAKEIIGELPFWVDVAIMDEPKYEILRKLYRLTERK